MKKEIIFIGAISPPHTGPGVKHKAIIRFLEKKGIKIIRFNILDSKIKLLLNLSILLFKYKKIIILGVSSKMRYILIPYCYILTKIRKDKIVFVPVGGKILEELNNLPKFLRKKYYKYIRSFMGIFVQSIFLKEKLINEINKEIVYYFPNFKDCNKDINIPKKVGSLHLVSLSRIKKTKGIMDTIEAVDLLINRGINVYLHIYGDFLKKDDNFKELFINKIKGKKYIKYSGFIEKKKINKEISPFHIFLFPTYHEGECFPGVFLDAFCAKMPVIATDWKYNKEIIKNNYNGFIIPIKNPKIIAEKVTFLKNNPDILRTMAENAYNSSKEFDSNKILGDLYTFLEKLFDGEKV